MKKLKWTAVLLLLAAVTLTIAPKAGPWALIAFLTAGILLFASLILAFKSYRRREMGRSRAFPMALFLASALLTAVTLFSFLRYRPALMAAPGYTLHNVTDPGILHGRIKTLQVIAEQVPCTYQPLGWQAGDAFYYQSDCDGNSCFWRYVIADDAVEPVAAVPDGLYAAPVPANDVTDGVLADVYPRELATVSRETFIAGDALPSPDGRFTVLVSRHIYGPQDVLLLTLPVSVSPQPR